MLVLLFVSCGEQLLVGHFLCQLLCVFVVVVAVELAVVEC